jgi:hypothetical protein
MKLRQALATLLTTGVFILAFQSTIVSASTQVCLVLSNPPGIVGVGPTTLTLGVMDYGNGHFSVAGTEQYTLATYPPAAMVNPVHGNAEVIGGKVEISLNGTSISGSLVNTSLHLVIDPATLNGTYIKTENGVVSRESTVAVVQCQLCKSGTQIEVAQICVHGDFQGDNEVLTPGKPVHFQLGPKGCMSSSCTIVYEASCSVTGTQSLTLSGTFCLGSTGAGVCTPDCGGGGAAQCDSQNLQAGEYVATIGNLQVNFTVPSTLPAGGICAGNPF